jgi:hypothetical protein
MKAEAVAQAREQEKRDAALAREMLLEEGHQERDIATLRPHELIELAGLAEPPAPATPATPEPTEHEANVAELKRRWFQLADFERREACNELGQSYDEIAAEKADSGPNIWQ